MRTKGEKLAFACVNLPHKSIIKFPFRSLMNDLEFMKVNDGYERWRHIESKKLSDLIQRRLHYLQNPADCSTAKKLICRLNKGCGLGCQLHHLVYCFIVAYATERTLILKSKGWRYHKGGFEEIYLPLSDTCLDANGVTHSAWPGNLFKFSFDRLLFIFGRFRFP